MKVSPRRQSSSSVGIRRGSLVQVGGESAPRKGTNVRFSLAGKQGESALVRVSLVKSHMFLPLCSKPSMLKLIENDPGIVQSYIRQCLDAGEAEAGDANLVIFIADGDVMALADIALGSSIAKANRVVKEISNKLRVLVDIAVESLCDEDDEYCSRISGVMHWRDVEEDTQFQIAYKKLAEIMELDLTSPPPGMEDGVVVGCKGIQIHMKTLVKELFTQRVEKSRAGGNDVTNVFDGDTLELVPGNKYKKRFDALLKACLLEISMILVGAEHNDTRFTEMQYMNNDAAGMTKIAKGLLKLRATLSVTPTSPFITDLKIFAGYNHGIELLNVNEPPESEASLFPTINCAALEQ